MMKGYVFCCSLDERVEGDRPLREILEENAYRVFIKKDFKPNMPPPEGKVKGFLFLKLCKDSFVAVIDQNAGMAGDSTSDSGEIAWDVISKLREHPDGPGALDELYLMWHDKEIHVDVNQAEGLETKCDPDTENEFKKGLPGEAAKESIQEIYSFMHEDPSEIYKIIRDVLPKADENERVGEQIETRLQKVRKKSEKKEAEREVLELLEPLNAMFILMQGYQLIDKFCNKRKDKSEVFSDINKDDLSINCEEAKKQISNWSWWKECFADSEQDKMHTLAYDGEKYVFNDSYNKRLKEICEQYGISDKVPTCNENNESSLRDVVNEIFANRHNVINECENEEVDSFRQKLPDAIEEYRTLSRELISCIQSPESTES